MPNTLPPNPVDPLVPRQWAGAVVGDSLNCRKCGYDLRGLSADSRCPECGLEIWSSVLSTVDPQASRLPRLRNPAAVGDSLVALSLCMLLGMLLLVTPSVARMVESLDSSGAPNWSDVIPSLNWILAGALLVVALWALWTLSPPRGSETQGAVWIDIWRIGIGMTGWLAFGCVWVLWLDADLMLRSVRSVILALHLAGAVFATIGLIGLRGVFRIIGERSREYRRSKGGRQSVELIITATAAGVIAALVQYFSRSEWVPADWRYATQMISMVVLWSSNFMVLIGLSYLVVNAWWIRHSLRSPPPAVDELLIPPMVAEKWVYDQAE